MFISITLAGLRVTGRVICSVENGRFNICRTLLNQKCYETARKPKFRTDSTHFHSVAGAGQSSLCRKIDPLEEVSALNNGGSKRLSQWWVANAGTWFSGFCCALDFLFKHFRPAAGSIFKVEVCNFNPEDEPSSELEMLERKIQYTAEMCNFNPEDGPRSGPETFERKIQYTAEPRRPCASICRICIPYPRYWNLIHYHSHHSGGSARDHDQAKNVEDVLFDMFRSEETGLLPIGKFLAALRSTGLRKNDPRLAEMTENLKKAHKLSGSETGSPETIKLDRETFKNVISANIVLISRAFRHQFIIPDFQGFTKHIEDFYWKCKSNTEGKVASYIPQLARMNPDCWGVSICTIDGQRFSIGDVNIPFTLQSCSKPLTYAIALDQLGADVVHQYVGQEPSGRMFNELILDYNKKPHNPMINAGAIIVCSLLKTLVKHEMTLAEKFDFTMSNFKKLAGGEYLGFNNAIFLSEREAADRNYALGFYMREHKCYPEKANLRECMDFYFQCCSMEGNCDCMAVMAATLANGGICPITDEKVLKPDSVRDVLSLMHSCGMYDYSGQFAFKVGLPAKSGVCGGMLVVIPNVMGICTWSPPLDSLGNSCRGVQFCEELVREFNFHRYDNLKHAANKKDPRRHRFETKGLSIVNLLFSAASGDVTAMRRHRLSGMDMTLSDYDGRTALHLCAAEGHMECVQFLLEQCNVPHNPKDRWGNTPIDEAHTFGHAKVIEFLEQWEKKVRIADLTRNDDNDSLPPPLSSASGSPPASTTGVSDVSIGDSSSTKFP